MDELLEAFRNPFTLIYVSFFLSCCLVSGSTQVSEAVELEFQAFRLQQYEIGQVQYGSRSSKVQYEAVSLNSKNLRKCIITLWKDLAASDIEEIFSKGTGALLVIIPEDLDSLSPNDRSLFFELEKRLAVLSTNMAVYVAHSSPAVNTVLSDVSSSGVEAESATQQLLSSISANTFQFTSTGSPSSSPLNYVASNVIARLTSERSHPTIIIAAHYDSHSVFPGASAGADSNGSGVVILLELLAIFSKYYNTASSVSPPPYNLVFVWTAGGKYNYQGSKVFAEVLDEVENRDLIKLVLCLDTLGGAGPLHMHASKQPSDASVAHSLLQRLRAVSLDGQVELVTKKISKQATQLNWEHERYNIKRLPSVTLSRLAAADDFERRSMLDTPSQISLDTLEKNTKAIAEALLGIILSAPERGGNSDSRVHADFSMLPKDSVDRSRLAHFVRQFATRPRPLSDEAITKATADNILAAASTYSAGCKTAPVRFADIQVWGGVTDKVLAELVKPAIFELIIAAAIFAYLTVIYQVTIRAEGLIGGLVSSSKKRM